MVATELIEQLRLKAQTSLGPVRTQIVGLNRKTNIYKAKSTFLIKQVSCLKLPHALYCFQRERTNRNSILATS